ncbi:MAG: MlaC/ttg2D family ABC transporter substrate-binding protein [Gammaproteobacteria bacterium]
MQKLIRYIAVVLVVGFAPAALANSEPADLVRSTSDEILNVLKEQAAAGERNPQVINDKLVSILEPVVDFDHFAKSVLGKHWRKASEDQRTRFIAEFRSFLIRSQTKPLTDFADTEVNVLSSRAKNEKNVAVYSEMDQNNGKQPVSVIYLFRKNKQDEWKLVNLVIEGLNLLKNFRTSFSDEINKKGIDGLIKHLAESNLRALGQ